MDIGELIRSRFCELETLSKMLAQYAGEPAVFCLSPPDDEKPGWEDNVHYPRIIYNYDMQAGPERNTDGALSVILVCQNTADVFPELIEPEIKKCLKDVILNPDDESLYVFAWSRTDSFEIPDGKTKLLIGCEIRFDIIEYTGQETTDPDPVAGMNLYLKELYENAVIIGLDRMERVTVASRDAPVIYCRLLSLGKLETTNTVAWMECRMALHFLCPHNETRFKMAAATAEMLSKDAEYKLLDGSPLRVQRLQVDYKSDYLKSGQVIVTGRFGILRYRAQPHRLMKANIAIQKTREV